MQDAKKSPSRHHRTFMGCIFATKACIDKTIRKKLVKQQYLLNVTEPKQNKKREQYQQNKPCVISITLQSCRICQCINPLSSVCISVCCKMMSFQLLVFHLQSNINNIKSRQLQQMSALQSEPSVHGFQLLYQ